MSRKLLDERIERVDVRSIDFHRRRITNASPSVGDYDYVVRKELEAFITLQPVQTATVVSGGISSGVTYDINLYAFAVLSIDNLTISTNPTAAKSLHALFVAVDELDTEWFGVGSIDSITDPITFDLIEFIEDYGENFYGRHFVKGDYIVADTSGTDAGFHDYEILLITAKTGNSVTCSRAQFGTIKRAATKFYLLIKHEFSFPLRRNNSSDLSYTTDGIRKRFDCYLRSKCVAACSVRIDCDGGFSTAAAKKLFPSTAKKRSPGTRTFNGGEYICGISGILLPTQELGVRVPISLRASLRVMYSAVKVAPVGTDPIYIDIKLLAPQDATVTEIDRVKGATSLEIDTIDPKLESQDPLNYISYDPDDPPRDQNGPYDSLSLTNWPYPILKEDAELDITVMQSGDQTPGSDLTVVIKT